jgi:benzoyl-CoA reductase/2-hydroxyglutaryl-CoA dehydratase subunit BcrC/BadD/HgdB
MEAFKVKDVAEKMKMPFLRIETDYSMEDMGQLKTRVEAFLEMIGKGAHA